MPYLGLARKWRPQKFEDLIGQRHITTTLINAIKTDRVIQGYLFTGTRGIGKTSVARILAKTLRCQKSSELGVPCNQCQDCQEIAEGRSIDVLEIDGASNNGVDAVREIRENAKFLPSSGSKKIYIIDEVHMLTIAAFNALLKTLEEPPPHVIFIFATTDAQKIPNTVLSRCQRFDFKRVSEKELREHLNSICKTEGVSIADDALVLLTREAEGSVRDALSLLDQILSVGQSPITADLLTDSLGLVDKKTVLNCVTHILKRNPIPALEAVGQVYLHGFDLKQFGRELLRYFRSIILADLLEKNKVDHDHSLGAYLDVTDVDLADIRSLVGIRSLEDLDMLFRVLNYGLEEVSRSTMPKIVLDVLVIKMACSSELVRVADISEADAIESKLAQADETTPASLASSRAPSEEIWAKALALIKADKPLLGSILENMSFSELQDSGQILVLKLMYFKDHSFYRDQLQSKAYQEILSKLLKTHFGRTVRLEFEEVTKRFESIEEKTRREVLESEPIRATQQLLGAKLEELVIR